MQITDNNQLVKQYNIIKKMPLMVLQNKQIYKFQIWIGRCMRGNKKGSQSQYLKRSGQFFMNDQKQQQIRDNPYINQNYRKKTSTSVNKNNKGPKQNYLNPQFSSKRRKEQQQELKSIKIKNMQLSKQIQKFKQQKNQFQLNLTDFKQIIAEQFDRKSEQLGQAVDNIEQIRQLYQKNNQKLMVLSQKQSKEINQLKIIQNNYINQIQNLQRNNRQIKQELRTQIINKIKNKQELNLYKLRLQGFDKNNKLIQQKIKYHQQLISKNHKLMISSLYQQEKTLAQKVENNNKNFEGTLKNLDVKLQKNIKLIQMAIKSQENQIQQKILKKDTKLQKKLVDIQYQIQKNKRETKQMFGNHERKQTEGLLKLQKANKETNARIEDQEKRFLSKFEMIGKKIEDRLKYHDLKLQRLIRSLEQI